VVHFITEQIQMSAQTRMRVEQKKRKRERKKLAPRANKKYLLLFHHLSAIRIDSMHEL